MITYKITSKIEKQSVTTPHYPVTPLNTHHATPRWDRTQAFLDKEIEIAKEKGMVVGAYVVQTRYNSHKLRQIDKIETDVLKVYGTDVPNFIKLKALQYQDVGWHYSELSLVTVDGSDEVNG